jgi:hypothetical protein
MHDCNMSTSGDADTATFAQFQARRDQPHKVTYKLSKSQYLAHELRNAIKVELLTGLLGPCPIHGREWIDLVDEIERGSAWLVASHLRTITILAVRASLNSEAAQRLAQMGLLSTAIWNSYQCKLLSMIKDTERAKAAANKPATAL